MNISNAEALVWVLQNSELMAKTNNPHDHTNCISTKQINRQEAEISIKSKIQTC